MEPHVTSSVTDLPLSCKSAAERIQNALKDDCTIADLSEEQCLKLKELERDLSASCGKTVYLVAYGI